MSVAEIMHEIDTLPAPERWQVLEHTRHTLKTPAHTPRPRRVLSPEFARHMATGQRGLLMPALDAARGAL